MAVGRPGPALAVAARPVVGDGAVEHFDEAGGDLAAAVPALIDDQRGAGTVANELPDEIALAVDAGVGDVDVADLSVGRLLDVGAVALDPVAVAEVVLAGDGPDEDLARRGVERGLGRDGERDGALGEALEGGVGVLGGVEGDAVDGKEVVAFLDVDAGL